MATAFLNPQLFINILTRVPGKGERTPGRAPALPGAGGRRGQQARPRRPRAPSPARAPVRAYGWSPAPTAGGVGAAASQVYKDQQLLTFPNSLVKFQEL